MDHRTGPAAAELCRKHRRLDATFHKCRSNYGGLEISDGSWLGRNANEDQTLNGTNLYLVKYRGADHGRVMGIVRGLANSTEGEHPDVRNRGDQDEHAHRFGMMIKAAAPHEESDLRHDKKWRR